MPGHDSESQPYLAQVHADAERLVPGCDLPRAALARRFLEDPAPDRDDQPVLLEQRDEVDRRHLAAHHSYTARFEELLRIVQQ